MSSEARRGGARPAPPRSQDEITAGHPPMTMRPVISRHDAGRGARYAAAMATGLGPRIGDQELAARRHLLLEHLAPRGVRGVVLFGPTAILYLTGFSFIPTERPLAMAFTADRLLALVPALERAHVRASVEVH